MIEDFNNIDNEELRLILDIKRVTAMEKVPHPDIDKERNALWQRIHHNDIPKKKSFFSKYWYVAASIAAVIVVVAGLGYYLYFGHQQQYNGIQVYAADNTAQELKLFFNGKLYVLNESSAAKKIPQLGIEINGHSIKLIKPSENINSGYRTLTTPTGGIYTVTLDDGTTIRMNAASKLTLPNTFAKEKRIVRLDGEAYFDVAHDKAHPFIVLTKYFQTTIVGTKFNIRAYSPIRANITLVEGKVQIQNKKSKPLTLLPKEQASLLSDGHLTKQKTDTDPSLEWQKGVFYFDDVPLIEIMQELGRWYNIDIIFENKKVIQERMHFVADHSENIQKAIDNLNELGMFTIINDANKIIIR
jgi:transmembrane sensor